VLDPGGCPGAPRGDRCCMSDIKPKRNRVSRCLIVLPVVVFVVVLVVVVVGAVVAAVGAGDSVVVVVVGGGGHNAVIPELIFDMVVFVVVFFCLVSAAAVGVVVVAIYLTPPIVEGTPWRAGSRFGPFFLSLKGTYLLFLPLMSLASLRAAGPLELRPRPVCLCGW